LILQRGNEQTGVGPRQIAETMHGPGRVGTLPNLINKSSGNYLVTRDPPCAAEGIEVCWVAAE